jgi:hypothetical protein
VQACRTDTNDPADTFAAQAMNDATETSGRLYAIRLLAPEPGADTARIAGRVEHVLSGRCHDFDDGAMLLACLACEQQQQQTTAGGR